MEAICFVCGKGRGPRGRIKRVADPALRDYLACPPHAEALVWAVQTARDMAAAEAAGNDPRAIAIAALA